MSFPLQTNGLFTCNEIDVIHHKKISQFLDTTE